MIMKELKKIRKTSTTEKNLGRRIKSMRKIGEEEAEGHKDVYNETRRERKRRNYLRLVAIAIIYYLMAV